MTAGYSSVSLHTVPVKAGSACAGLHLSMCGMVNPTSDIINMWLGILAATLPHMWPQHESDSPADVVVRYCLAAGDALNRRATNSVPCAGLHLSMWGEIEPKSDTINMWLGIPAASLSQLGIKGYSREAMLPISVQGSLQKPKVGWVE